MMNLSSRILSSTSSQIVDVIKLRTADTHSFVMIDGVKIELKNDSYAGSIKHPVSDLTYNFMNRQLKNYFVNTPISRIVKQNFFMQQELYGYYYVIVNQSILPDYEAQLFGLTQGHPVLQHVVRNTLQQLQRTDSIDRRSLYNLLLKNVVNTADQLKDQKHRLEVIVGVVEQRLRVIQKQIAVAEDRLKTKARGRVRAFTTFLIGQAAFLHYFVYFNLSWDIMEPAICVLGNIDLIFAYYFFLMKGTSYSPGNWTESMIKNKRHRYLKSEGVNIQKYQEYVQIREYLKQRLALLSHQEIDVMRVVNSRLKLIDSS